MRAARLVLVVTGVLAIAWGARLLLPQLSTSVATWLFAGPLLHDALLAPVVAAIGIAVARLAPSGWRAPVATGLVVSGALVLISLPLVLRPSAAPQNPGLADRNYPLGLLVALAVVWLLVLLAGLIGSAGRRRADRRPNTSRASTGAQAPPDRRLSPGPR